ncbi:AT-hook motif nuclear-localized protein 8-like [Arachis stenosperma]|uniref:AT-hook motif nuclear-localized protein 8-like n=1 Tax=Arachis stenosperma TaxID=217475 RepID=UPI0025AD35F6|nr:AT-hook motif nuclear-localized protein 8-like [Arachis stenosperma]
MDSREPHHQPSHHHHPHHHHHQQPPPPPNMMVGMGPTQYSPSMMAPTTARFPFTSVVHHQHQQHQQQQQQQQQQQHHQHQHQHQQPPVPPTNNNGNAANDNNNTVALYDGSSSALKPCGFPTTDSASAAKKKRGRPRKYSPDGNIALGLSTTHASPSPAVPPRADSSAGGSGGGGATPSSEPLAKKHRGRPPGSGKKQMDALGAGGIGFTPHVILVESGEDVAAKIMAFCQQGPRTVVILSANGAICNVTLKQPTTLGGTVTYEGRFEIISLSGSLLHSENNSDRSRPGGLNVSLAGSDGRVLGGGVAGMLTAASPVQVIVGSFIEDGKKSNSSSNNKSGPSSTPSTQMLNFGAPMTPTSPTSQGASSESSDDNDQSPPNRGPGLYNNASQPIHNMSMYHHQLWAGQTQQ